MQIKSHYYVLTNCNQHMLLIPVCRYNKFYYNLQNEICCPFYHGFTNKIHINSIRVRLCMASVAPSLGSPTPINF